MEAASASAPAGAFISAYAGGLERAFPDLFFDWYPTADGLTVEIGSRYGTTSRVEAGYPMDLEPVYAGARRHVERDVERDLLAERLEAAAWVGRGEPARHLPYILRWLVHPQRAEVVFGDHPDVEPVVRSPSAALIRTPERTMKIWPDGAAVLHDARADLAVESLLESTGLDLTRTTLREFQVLWLTGDRDDAATEPAMRRRSSSAHGAAALTLLNDYDDACWLRHRRLHREPADASEAGLDWQAANRITVMHTEATLQDRAVLAVACHLSDTVAPLVSLPDALHHVGAARWDVMKALDSIAGRHPDPHSGWPTDCRTCP